MREKKKYLAGTKRILDQSQINLQKPYYTNILGKKFIVYPNVFSPKHFFDSEFFAKTIQVKKDEEFLEIGPGSGVVSVSLALKGANVTAVDINSDAVKNTRENASLHSVSDRITVHLGDIYSPLGKQKFDTIFWNTPFGYTDNESITTLEKAVFDPGYKSHTKFFAEAKEHLKPNGKVLVGFSTTLGHIGKLKEIAKENGFSFRLIDFIESVETHPVKFELFESKPLMK